VCHSPSLYLSWYRKWNALQGTLAALFLVEILGDALNDISSASALNYDQVIRDLEEEDDANYKQAQNSALPPGAEDIMKDLDGINLEDVYKTPNFCHTARVPAEIRHKGILLEGPPGDVLTYQQGISDAEAHQSHNIDSEFNSEFMVLVRDDSTRQTCGALVNLDHRDYFYVNDQDGWKKLVLPNDAEIKEYSRGQELRGLIAVCFASKDLNAFSNSTLSAKDINKNMAEIQVNGEPVVRLTNILIGLTTLKPCWFLRGSQGHYWTPNSDAQFEIRARVIHPNTFLRISSFIVW
jgi:hypothetical protein